jgi:hypothetical protein
MATTLAYLALLEELEEKLHDIQLVAAKDNNRLNAELRVMSSTFSAMFGMRFAEKVELAEQSNKVRDLLEQRNQAYAIVSSVALRLQELSMGLEEIKRRIITSTATRVPRADDRMPLWVQIDILERGAWTGWRRGKRKTGRPSMRI